MRSIVPRILMTGLIAGLTALPCVLGGCESGNRSVDLDQATALTDAPLDQIAWLAGHWRGAEGRPEELWMSPAGGTMLGTGRDIKDGKTIFHEYLRIEAGPDGALTLYAAPNGSEPVPFELVKADSRVVIFQNPNHDYPQRIIYRRTGGFPGPERLETEVADLGGLRVLRGVLERVR